MTDVRIAHLRKRYRLRAGDTGARIRLDRALESAINDSLLEAALERAGIPATEEVCVRRVESFFRDSQSATSSRLAIAWSVALADAIAARVREGGPDVIRYASRHEALADMACRAARGDFDRAWAWRQLDIWRAGDFLPSNRAAEEIARTLTRELHASVAVLQRLARAGRLPALLGDVTDEQWKMVARLALVAAGAGDATLQTLDADDVNALDEHRQLVAAAAARVAARSAIFRAAAKHAASARSARLVTSIAALALLECEPHLASAPYAEQILAELATVLRRSWQAPPRTAESDRSPAGSDATTERAEQSHASSEHDEFAPPAASPRAPGATSAGGLLFVLHLVRDLDVPAKILSDAVLAPRPLRWTLHRLALDLTGVDGADPAALAFAGLAPGSIPPSRAEPPPTDGELTAIGSLRDAIVALLRERVAAPVEESDDALLRRVTTRRAEVVADPAWIAVHLSLRDVATDVRRAGLDLDLGWLPWLGVIVRFVYA